MDTNLTFLPITSFVLCLILLGLFLFIYIINLKKLLNLNKFISQDIKIYKNKNLYNISVWWSIAITLILFVGILITFIIYMINLNVDERAGLVFNYVFNEILFLILAIWVLWYVVYANSIAQSSLVVVKNNKIVFLNHLLDIDQIILVFCDDKRKYIYVDIRDKKIKGNNDQIKLKYDYKLKDFFINLNINTKF